MKIGNWKLKIALMAVFLTAPTFALRADINSDGRVDLLDLAILAEEWLMTEQVGPELVSDGGFDLGSPPWMKEGNVSFISGHAEVRGDNSDRVYQDIDITAGKTYRVTYTITAHSSGTATVKLGTAEGTGRSEAGTFTETIIAAGDARIDFNFAGGLIDLEFDNVSVKEVYDLGILTGIEDWAITKLKALTEYGNPLFRQDEAGRDDCVDHWIGQLGMGNSGIESFVRYAPFAFVQAELERVKREGDYDANIRINLAILIGQKSVEEGLCRIGSGDVVGANRMFEVVFTAFDGVHPGDGFTCDEFYLTDVVENINTPKKCGLQLIFSAHWIPVTT